MRIEDSKRKHRFSVHSAGIVPERFAGADAPGNGSYARPELNLPEQGVYVEDYETKHDLPIQAVTRPVGRHRDASVHTHRITIALQGTTHRRSD